MPPPVGGVVGTSSVGGGGVVGASSVGGGGGGGGVVVPPPVGGVVVPPPVGGVVVPPPVGGVVVPPPVVVLPPVVVPPLPVGAGVVPVVTLVIPPSGRGSGRTEVLGARELTPPVAAGGEGGSGVPAAGVGVGAKEGAPGYIFSKSSEETSSTFVLGGGRAPGVMRIRGTFGSLPSAGSVVVPVKTPPIIVATAVPISCGVSGADDVGFVFGCVEAIVSTTFGPVGVWTVVVVSIGLEPVAAALAFASATALFNRCALVAFRRSPTLTLMPCSLSALD